MCHLLGNKGVEVALLCVDKAAVPLGWKTTLTAVVVHMYKHTLGAYKHVWRTQIYMYIRYKHMLWLYSAIVCGDKDNSSDKDTHVRRKR